MRDEKDSYKHLVFVVDDEINVLKAINSILKTDGFEVRVSSNPIEALKLINDLKPSLVISDVMMPKMNGYELCKAIKQSPDTLHTKVILITGMISESDVGKGIDAGAVDFIRKPFEQNDIRLRVRNQIRLLDAEKHEKELLDRLNTISDAANDAIVLVNYDGVISHWNLAAEKLFGCPADDAIDQKIFDIIAFDGTRSEQFGRKEILNVPESGAIMLLTARGKNDVPFKVEVSLSHTCGRQGKEIVFIIRDITKRFQEEERWRALVEGAAEGIIAVDIQTQEVVLANNALCKMTGFELDELMSLNLSDIYPEEHQHIAKSEFAAMSDGKARLVRELPCVKKDGSTFYADISSAPIKLGDRTCFVGFLTDVTDRRLFTDKLLAEQKQREQVEIELRHAQKLEAVGQLAAGIAHEINTPAQFVGDNTRFFKESFSDIKKILEVYASLHKTAVNQFGRDPLIQKLEDTLEELDIDYLLEEIPCAIEQSLDGIKRIATIVRAMKEFAHPGSEGKSLTNINQCLSTTITVSRNEWKYVADVSSEFDSALPCVPCVPSELNQVFLNLIVNAAHAIGEKIEKTKSDAKGKITITTKRRDENVEISFMDNGPGIPETIQHRVMEPFFTTKEVGKGTGQGLAIARTIIVEKHNGKLDFQSKEDIGTTFIITLPIEDGAVCASPQTA